MRLDALIGALAPDEVIGRRPVEIARPGVRHALRRQGHALRLHPGRRPRRTRARSRGRRSGGRRARRRAPGGRRRPAARRRVLARRGRSGRGRVLRRADRVADRRGRHRDERQDHDDLPAACDPRGRRRTRREWSAPSTGSSGRRDCCRRSTPRPRRSTSSGSSGRCWTPATRRSWSRRRRTARTTGGSTGCGSTRSSSRT